MRKSFVVSLCRDGVLGGGMYVDEEKIVYRTNKISVSSRYRNMKIRLKDILETSCDWMLFFPTVTIRLKNGEAYKFIVFNRMGLLRMLALQRTNAASDAESPGPPSFRRALAS